MRRVAVGFAGILLAGWNAARAQSISAVEIRGAPAAVRLETQPGSALDPGKLSADVKTLWRSGRFSDIRVEAVPDGDRVRVIFRTQVRRTLRIMKARIDPPTPGVTLELPPYAELDARGAEEIAANVRKRLADSGYPEAKVSAELRPAAPGRADLVVHVDRGRSIDVGDVTVSGELGAKPGEIRKALRATRTKTLVPGIPGLWNGWRLRPAYSPDAVQSDVLNLRSFYYNRGYFDARVAAGSVDIRDGRAHIGYEVQSGPRYSLPVQSVCRELFEERRESERAGIRDFSAALHVTDETVTVQRGLAYRVGRIEFRGNHTFRDSTLRRAMLLDEGAPLDQTLLRKSIARLNRTGLFEPLDQRSVMVSTPAGSDFANVTIRLKERKMRQWLLSGPAGPMSAGGPLDLAIGSRLPLALATCTVSLHFLLLPRALGAMLPFLPDRRFLTALTIERPSLPGQPFVSGFAVTPQFGWQGLAAGYGVSQARSFLSPHFQSRRDLQPALPLTIQHADSEGTMYCEMPGTKLDWARRAAGIAFNLAFSLMPF
jgi:outer membrane protein assembly factor BamA